MKRTTLIIITLLIVSLLALGFGCAKPAPAPAPAPKPAPAPAPKPAPAPAPKPAPAPAPKPAPAPAPKPLPKILTITTPALGSADYLKATGARVAVESRSDVMLRIEGLPSAKAQLEPLRSGESEFTIQSGATAYRIANGLEDFEDWGPTPLRRAWGGKPNTYAMVTRGNSGFKTIADLKGKRLPQTPASWGWSNNVTAALAFGGLTLDDVQIVNVSSIPAGLSGPLEGTVDATLATLWSGAVQELAASRHGIHWFNMPKEDKAGWDRVLKVVPWAGPFTEPGAGDVDVAGFAYEQSIWVYESVPDEVVYTLVKSMKEGFEDMQKIAPDLKGWTIEQCASLDGKATMPFHSGTIKYLKEIGAWTSEHEAFQQKALQALK
ncbi:TAXI family TRAP transporter solute-binding subunit [Chloroflexota bacterium]